MAFCDSPFDLEGFILPDGTNICPGGEQEFIVRIPKAVSDPVYMQKTISFSNDNNIIEFKLSDIDEQYFVDVKISPVQNGFMYSIKVNGPEPVWLVEWKISGLDMDRVLVPALGGQELDKSMPAGTVLSYKYPFWWNAQFVVGELNKGCFLLDGKDSSPDLKLLRVGKDNEYFSWSYGIEADAPLESTILEGEWFLEYIEGGWQDAVDVHRSWLEDNFNLSEYRDHPHFPEWTDNINFILEIWGARKGRKAMHTFPQMIEKIEEFAKLHDPEKTLLYLPGFAENGIDSHAPDYNPSQQCGGEKEFSALVSKAHDIGYRVMIHTNVLALTYTHSQYEKFSKYQVLDVFDRPQGWAMDMDGDWLTEPYFAYVNPGFTEWGDLMADTFRGLIDKFKLDAVFLDQTLLAFNVSRGPNFIEGMRSHVGRLQAAFPDILFAGEGLHEQNVEVLPLAQIHGIDSITDVHGMEGKKPWRTAHPVSKYLFERYTRYTAHLLTKHPSHPMFKSQEQAYELLDVIPALCLYDYSQKIDLPEVHRMIERANKL